MTKQNSSNQDFTSNADGFDISGGTTARKLTVTGAAITLTGSGTNVYTMPTATDTLVGRASTDTLTNKTIDAAGTGNSITNVANLSVKRQNDTSNATVTGARIETGWGVITATAVTVLTETVTFGTAFTTAPIVIVTSGGDNVSGTATYGAGTAARNNAFGIAHTITTSNFIVRMRSEGGVAWTSGDTVFYQWIAIGT